MKRILSASLIFICILYSLLPICQIFAVAFDYVFYMPSFSIPIVVLAVISLAVTVLLLIQKVSLNKPIAVLSALLLPLSAINGLLFVKYSDWNATIIFVLICCVCSAIILFKFARPTPLKIVSIVLSSLLILLLLYFSFLDLIFQDFVSVSVVKSIKSPQNTYTAEVIDSDQGVLGGDTFVEVWYNNTVINLVFCEFKKAPIRVYEGNWGQFENMQIYWKNEQTLLINNKEYSIKN